jgi:hypothetical protein
VRSRYLLLLWIFPLLSVAQVITYDTLSVSTNDKRSIARYQTQRMAEKGTPLDDIRQSNGEREKPLLSFDKSKLRLGANLALSVSKNYTRLGLGPQAGYQFNRYFMAGVGIRYYYSKARTSEYVAKDHLLGANLFGYFYPVSFLTIFMQPEINYIWSGLTRESGTETIYHSGLVPSLIAGAGFRIGRSHITLNYDLIQHADSPHPSGVYLGISAFF